MSTSRVASEKKSAGIGKGTPGPGRKKGVPNKDNAQLKEMILSALDKSGGVDYLVGRANDPKTATAFLSLIGKVLPLQVTGDPENPVGITLIERVIVKK